MTPFRYRLLLAAHVLASLLWLGFALAADIRAEPHTLELGPWRGMLLMLASGVLIGTYAAMFIGLFTLQRWGRTLAVLCTALSLAVLAWLPGAQTGSALQTVAGFVAATAWGAALALAFTPPLEECFTRRRAERTARAATP